MCLGVTSNLSLTSADLAAGSGAWLAASAVASVSQAALVTATSSVARAQAPRGLRVLLTFALLCGLLTFPTTCQCGDVLPHPHILFLLPGHHHGGPSAEPASRPGTAVAATGPQLQAPAVAPAFGDALAAALALAWFGLTRRWRRLLSEVSACRSGQVVAPDPPPPRTASLRSRAVSKGNTP